MHQHVVFEYWTPAGFGPATYRDKNNYSLQLTVLISTMVRPQSNNILAVEGILKNIQKQQLNM